MDKLDQHYLQNTRPNLANPQGRLFNQASNNAGNSRSGSDRGLQLVQKQSSCITSSSNQQTNLFASYGPTNEVFTNNLTYQRYSVNGQSQNPTQSSSANLHSVHDNDENMFDHTNQAKEEYRQGKDVCLYQNQNQESRALQEVPLGRINDMQNRVSRAGQQYSQGGSFNTLEGTSRRKHANQENIGRPSIGNASQKKQNRLSGSRGRLQQSGYNGTPNSQIGGSFKKLHKQSSQGQPEGTGPDQPQNHGLGIQKHRTSTNPQNQGSTAAALKPNGPSLSNSMHPQPLTNNPNFSYKKSRPLQNNLTSDNKVESAGRRMKSNTKSNRKFRSNGKSHQASSSAVQGFEGFGSPSMRPFGSPSKKIISDLQSYNDKTHPTLNMSRQVTTDVDRQNINVRVELANDVDRYLRGLEQKHDVSNCLERHLEMDGALRARMIDWMIEVLTNFKCDDQTFFLAVGLMDRYFKGSKTVKQVGDLHVIGVTCMFVASKYEDIYPLKMKTVHEKIGHGKLDISVIKSLELEILQTLDYKIHAPTVLDFLKVYLVDVLGIHIQSRTDTKRKEVAALAFNSGTQPTDSTDLLTPFGPAELQSYLIEKMAIYLSKMAMHEPQLSARLPSLLAVGSIYVALKICEQLRHTELINNTVVAKLIQVSQRQEEEILDVSQRILFLAQNFDTELPGLDNLKKTHFSIITQLL